MDDDTKRNIQEARETLDQARDQIAHASHHLAAALFCADQAEKPAPPGAFVEASLRYLDKIATEELARIGQRARIHNGRPLPGDTRSAPHPSLGRSLEIWTGDRWHAAQWYQAMPAWLEALPRAEDCPRTTYPPPPPPHK